MNKLLIICGPTATGKTQLAIDICSKTKANILSADSRQVYRFADIVTGKDIPAGSIKIKSQILWQDRVLTHYDDKKTKIWLTDLCSIKDKFNVSHWNQCANLVISNLNSDKILPIIVGISGLYIKSLTHEIESINIPPNDSLRLDLSKKSIPELFTILNNKFPHRAIQLNDSDRYNPRRLIRAIEVGSFKKDIDRKSQNLNYFQIGLTSSLELASKRITKRVIARLESGAIEEFTRLSSTGFDPSPLCSGYKEISRFLNQHSNKDVLIKSWSESELREWKKQMTWWKKQPNIVWINTDAGDWNQTATDLAFDWYNK